MFNNTYPFELNIPHLHRRYTQIIAHKIYETFIIFYVHYLKLLKNKTESKPRRVLEFSFGGVLYTNLHLYYNVCVCVCTWSMCVCV